MSLFGGKKINAFGLDVSDISVKIMQLKKDGKKIRLQAYTDQPLADKVISNHMIMNERRLAEDISRAMSVAKKVDTRYVVCSVPEVKSFVRSITLPKMSESEIEGAIPYQLESDIPIPVDQVYLDWQMTRQTANDMEFLVTAAPKDYIDTLVSSLHMAKLKPVAMELESQATARAVISLEYKDKNVLIVDLSTIQTSFVIVKKGIIEYTSSIPIAGNSFTESIARSLGVSADQAEKIKRGVGLSADQKNIRSLLLPIVDNIVDEMKNVLHFFEEHVAGNTSIDMILLCGGSSRLIGMADYISARLNLGTAGQMGPIVLANPWINMSGLDKANPMSAEESLGYVTALGLALRGVDYEIN